MTNIIEFEIDPYRAAMVFRHFEKTHMRLIDGELDYGEGTFDALEIGDPYHASMRESLGYMEDSKYGIHLSWCALNTVTLGEMHRYIAAIDSTMDGGEVVASLIVERSDDNIKGIFYCSRDSLNNDFDPDEVVSHIIRKNLENYPGVYQNECPHCAFQRTINKENAK